MSPTNVHNVSLSWVIKDILTVPGVIQAMLISSDGLIRESEGELSRDDSDRCAAAVSGLKSLAEGLAQIREGKATTTMVEADNGYYLVIPSGDGSTLFAVASENVDLGEVTYKMNSIVNQTGSHLSTPARQKP